MSFATQPAAVVPAAAPVEYAWYPSILPRPNLLCACAEACLEKAASLSIKGHIALAAVVRFELSFPRPLVCGTTEAYPFTPMLEFLKADIDFKKEAPIPSSVGTLLRQEDKVLGFSRR